MNLFNRYSFLFIKTGILLVYFMVSLSAFNNHVSLPIYIDAFFILLFIDFKNVLNLKNYYIVYLFLIFKLSAGFWYEDDYTLPFDGTLFFIAFLLGYEFKTVLNPYKGEHLTEEIDAEKYNVYIYKVEYWIKVFVILKLLYLLILIMQYGVVSFYSGQMLADKISNYGRKSVVDSILTVYAAFVDNFIIALVVLYVKFKSALRQNPNYLYLAVPLLLLPLMILSRSTFAFNLVAMLAIYAYFSNNITKVYAFLIPGAIVLFAVVAYIGFLRLNSYNSGEDFSQTTSGDQFFTELTPIIAYKGVKDNVGVIHYQYGKSIFLPLIFKPIPRGIWTDKPNNSSSIYLKEFDSGSYYAGFMIPLMIFGDLFINFGLYFTLLLLVLFGVLIARFNWYFTSKYYKRIDLYFILFFCFYSLLRNCLPESLISIVLMLIAKKIVEFFILQIKSKN